MVYQPYQSRVSGAYDNYYRQRGGNVGLPVFRGSPSQKGFGIGSMFSSLARTILPTIKSVAGKLGKTALQTGLRVASDGLQGRNLVESAKRHFTEAGINALDSLANGSQPRSAKRKKRSRPTTPRNTIAPKRRKVRRARGGSDAFS